MPRRLVVTILVALLIGSSVSGFSSSAAPIANDPFYRTWARTDLPVADQRVSRTWMWGPEAGADALLERYAEAPGGYRQVQYFDKTRMEINDPYGDPDALWYVTNGLLAKELITGALQVGDGVFERYQPAQVNIAGDPEPAAPTYATFQPLMARSATPVGWVLSDVVDTAGNVTSNRAYESFGVTAAYHVPDTDHSVASVFWEFMNSTGLVAVEGSYLTDTLFENPFYATGYPLTEAYWMEVRVAGIPTQVLTQVFERRVLTYTPHNPESWKVEAGNVGLHYFVWRYGELAKGLCSTVATPSYVDPVWSIQEEGLLFVMSEMGLSIHWEDPIRQELLEFADGLWAAYHLDTAQVGCFNANTELFRDWLQYTIYNYLTGEEPDWFNQLRKIRVQVRLAIEQPASPLGVKIRQIERGDDPLRMVDGPWAYWYYLLVPVSDFMMTPDARLGSYYLFEKFVDEYYAEIASDARRYDDFGDFLLVNGYIDYWVRPS